MAECNDCKGTGWMHVTGGVVKCGCRQSHGRDLSAPACAGDPYTDRCGHAQAGGRATARQRPSKIELIVAGMIEGRTRRGPITIAEIKQVTGLKERKVKQIVHDLRATYLLPIASSRGKNAGYYWAHSWEDWEPYWRQYKSQALDEFKTIYRVTRKNWPSFVGQLKLDFEGNQ